MAGEQAMAGTDDARSELLVHYIRKFSFADSQVALLNVSAPRPLPSNQCSGLALQHELY